MRKIITLRVTAQPALDMNWTTSDDIGLLESNVSKEELLKGFNLEEEDLGSVIWIPVDLDSTDYAELNNLGIKAPDYLPLWCGQTFGGSVAYHASVQDETVDDVVIEYDLGTLQVYSSVLPSWWAAERHKRGYVA